MASGHHPASTLPAHPHLQPLRSGPLLSLRSQDLPRPWSQEAGGQGGGNQGDSLPATKPWARHHHHLRRGQQRKGAGGQVSHYLHLHTVKHQSYYRAALLASYGYVTLALAFYGVDDLPPLYDSFDMNYFESAVDFLLSQPQVTRTKVGLFGSSTGGNLVLSMMSCLGAKIGASVVSGAAFASCPGHTHYNGQASSHDP